MFKQRIQLLVEAELAELKKEIRDLQEEMEQFKKVSDVERRVQELIADASANLALLEDVFTFERGLRRSKERGLGIWFNLLSSESCRSLE